MATKFKLDFIDENDEAFYGIVANTLDYKLALAINNKLNISLRCSTPIVPSDVDNPDFFFTKFSYKTKNSDMVIDLVSNRIANNHLLKKLQNIDFLFIIHFPESSEFIENCLAGIKEIPDVVSVFQIDISSQKDKRLKLLDL
ncbi:MAG: IPExxxVDY family protein [Bacteroidales bacterium]|nr:IPExxxVDY family protein [Bacteroidales bacterium]